VAPVSDRWVRRHVPCPGIAEALETGGVFYRVDGSDRETTLRAVVEPPRLPDEVDRDSRLRAPVARGRLGSTGIGEGIAVPHVRNPIVPHVPRPSITLCFLGQAVAFGSLDGQPVRALFTVVSPTIRAHLYMMSHVASALRAAAFKDAVLRAASREEILREARRVQASFRERSTLESTAEVS
jgi:PTS system nitrogen regulatory IIA component